MRRGDVYWAVLEPRSGSEQRGRRPVVVVSHDGFNQTPTWNSLLVVPISTSPSQGRRMPTVVGIAKGVGNLPEDSVVVCHQVTTLDRLKFDSKIGELPRDVLLKVGEAIKRSMDLV